MIIILKLVLGKRLSHCQVLSPLTCWSPAEHLPKSHDARDEGNEQDPWQRMAWLLQRLTGAYWTQGMDGNGGCWDYHEYLLSIIPSFPTFSTSFIRKGLKKLLLNVACLIRLVHQKMVKDAGDIFDGRQTKGFNYLSSWLGIEPNHWQY